MPSEYQSDGTCTEFNHEIDTRSNLRQKPLKNLNFNTYGSKDNSTSDLRAKHQTSETFPKTSHEMLKQKRQPWITCFFYDKRHISQIFWKTCRESPLIISLTWRCSVTCFIYCRHCVRMTFTEKNSLDRRSS